MKNLSAKPLGAALLTFLLVFAIPALGDLCPAASACGFIYSGGVWNSLSYPGSSSTFVYGINDSGEVVGAYQDINGRYGFLYSSGSYIPFQYSGGLGINDAGDITGYYDDAMGRHGFLYSSGNFITFDSPGAHETQASKINDSGQIVGRYYDPPVAPGLFYGHGFLYSSGTVTTLDYPVAQCQPLASGPPCRTALNGINDVVK